MVDKQSPALKEGICDRCGEFAMLAKYRKLYICRDCFVGDYDPEYVQWRIGSALSGRHPLDKIANGEDGEGLGFGKKRRGAQ